MNKSKIIVTAAAVLIFIVAVLCAALFRNTKQEPAETNSGEGSVFFNAEETADGALRFSAMTDNFIDAFNNAYKADKDADFLPPLSNWTVSDYTESDGRETALYTFSREPNIWSLPTVSIYSFSDNDYIREISLNFDDHSYAPNLFKQYEELCYYAIKAIMPDLSGDDIKTIYQDLNQKAYDFITTTPYSLNISPPIIYYKGGIGLYPYFAIGERMHLCIVPVTNEYLEQLKDQGAQVIEISEFLEFSQV